MHHRYEVIVGNIGRVYTGDDRRTAVKDFTHYREMSLKRVGRAADEQVTLWDGGEPTMEYDPAKEE